MKKRILLLGIIVLFTLLTGEEAVNSAADTQPKQENTSTKKKNTKKNEKDEVQDSLDQIIKEVQQERAQEKGGKPTDSQTNDGKNNNNNGSATPKNSSDGSHNNTGNNQNSGTVENGGTEGIQTVPANNTTTTPETVTTQPKIEKVKIDPKKPVKIAIDKEQEGPTFYKGNIIKYIVTKDGFVLEDSGSDTVHPMASLTKVMNILVALDAVDKGKKSLDDKVCFDNSTVNIGGSWLNVKQGECFTLRDLLRAENIYSANNAAYLVAKHIGDGSIDKFVEMMNKKAQELGMKNTKFYTPAGLPTSMTGKPFDESTAKDLYLMASEALKDPRIKEWASEKELVLINEAGEQVVYASRNEKLLGKEGIWGLKTGFHNLSGFNVIVTSKKNNLEIITIVLGEQTALNRTNTVLEEYRSIDKKIKQTYFAEDNMGEFKIKSGKKKKTDGYLAEDIFEIKGNEYQYEVQDLNKEASIEDGSVIGKLLVKKGEETVYEVNILAREEIKELSWFGKFLRMITFGLV